MSELNNPLEEPRETVAADAALRALKQTMLGPGHMVDEHALRQSGVDVDMLYATYETAIKPYLDYLHGYADIRTLDPHARMRSLQESRWDASLKAMVAPEPWEHRLVRAGIVERSVDMQAVFVLNRINLWCHSRDDLPTYVQLSAWLTRKGQWVLSYAQTVNNRSREVKAELLFWYDSIEDLWVNLHELVPDDYQVDYGSGGRRGQPAYMPLFIEHHLRRVLEATIDIRRGRLRTMRESAEVATARVGRVRFTSRLH